MTAKPKVLPLTRLLNDLRKDFPRPLGVIEAERRRWAIWVVSDATQGTEHPYIVGARVPR